MKKKLIVTQGVLRPHTFKASINQVVALKQVKHDMSEVDQATVQHQENRSDQQHSKQRSKVITTPTISEKQEC